MWHHIQYACYDNNCLWHSTPLCITSHPVYFWHHIQYVLYHHTAFMTTQWRYLTSHHHFGTKATVSVSSHKWHTHLYRCITVSITSQQVCKSSHMAHVWHHTQSTSHHILTWWHQTTVFFVTLPTILVIVSTVSVSSPPLYWWYHTNSISEITSAIIHNIICILYLMTATVWHHNHCIHDIRFPTYDITSRVYDISSPIPVTSQTLCLWIHVNYI